MGKQASVSMLPANRRWICSMVVALLIAWTPANWASEARRSQYKGWDSIALGNGLIEVQVVPAIGGRVMQLKLGDFEYLWVNPQLEGRTPPPGGVGPDGAWLNYGGDKLWPAPQGWDNDQQWPGPPDAVLDGGPYAAIIPAGAGSPVSLELTSGKDPRSGIRFSRVIKIFDGAARVSFDTTMKNIDSKPRRWGIWQVTQHNAAKRAGGGYNENLYCYCPANPKSIYPRGYHEMYGLVNNPSFSLDRENGIVCARYRRLVGKIGIDCSAGWLAVVDGTTGYAFVERFAYHPDRLYPDNASVEFWMHGVGQFVVGTKIAVLKEDPADTPYYVESEVLSPLTELQPGESYTFHLDWYAAKIGDNLPILDCTEVGVTCQRLVARTTASGCTISGRFGVFHVGKLELVFLDGKSREVGRSGVKLAVTPAADVALVDWPAGVAVPEDAQTVCLMLYGSGDQVLGELARAPIPR